MEIEDVVKELKLTTISLDTYIEKVFYGKCISDFSQVGLLNEWANSKKFYCSYSAMTLKYYGNYSLHDATHSVSILNAIVSVIGKERIEELCAMDLWMILHLAYGHDIGMPFSTEESLKQWRTILEPEDDFGEFIRGCLHGDNVDNKRAAEYVIRASGKVNSKVKQEFPEVFSGEELPTEWIVHASKYYSFLMAEFMRRNHAERTKKLLSDNKDLSIYKSSFTVASRFYNCVAQGAALHGMTFQELLELPHEEWYRDELCHPAFAAAMLRLGDLLDIDNNRFDSVALEFYGDLPRTSLLHRKKHEAITHLLYTKNKIEITAESDDIEVCVCAEDWFHYLHDEVENLIFHWSEIAPSCLGGCEMKIPVTKVYYCGKEFYGMQSQEFKVNKNMLIDLVIGRNLYYSQLDFLKEYLQNALDALKMKFWIDMCAGELDSFVKEEYKKAVRKLPKEKWLPMYFNEMAFARYKLEVSCELVKSETNALRAVRITVVDRGIGIDKECVKAISHIGSGWRKRKKYAKHLRNMPDWLKPTGGFGIGMQSGFMIADRVTIFTKCENSKGRKITLHSSAESGKIEEQEYDVPYHGTAISVDIPYDWFMYEDNLNHYKELSDSWDTDSFDEFGIRKFVFKLLKSYIHMIAGNALFPIDVVQERFVSEKINNLIPENLHLAKEKYDYKNNQYVVFYVPDKAVYVFWDSDNSILCKIESSVPFEKAELKWYYKGMRVWQDKEYKDSVLAKSIGNITIDIMTPDVKKCLTVDRNKFASEFDHEAVLCRFVQAYLNFFDAAEGLFDQMFRPTGSLEVISKKLFYLLIISKYYVTDGVLRNSIYKYLKTRKPDFDGLSNSDTYIDVVERNVQLDDETKTIVSDEFNKSPVQISYLCEKMWNQEDVYIIHEATAKELCTLPMGEKTKEAIVSKLPSKTKEFIASDELWTLLKIFPSVLVDLSNNHMLLKCYGEGRNQFISDDILLEKLVEFGERRNIVYMVDEESEYSKLFVNVVPKGLIKERKARDFKNVIISPISSIHANAEIIRGVIRDKDDPELEFVNYITGQDDFQILLEWVYKNQKHPQQYDKAGIEKCYQELIKELYYKLTRK